MKTGICTVLLFAVAAALFGQSGDGRVEEEGITFSWEVEGNFLLVELEAPTEGWVALGFGAGNKMKGANIIIGYVEDGEVVIEDHFATGKFAHKSDTDLGGENNLLDPQGSQSEGITRLAFRYPLDTGDPNDTILLPGEPVVCILAWGRRDNVRSKHKGRAKITVRL